MYAPNNDDPAFFINIFSHLSELPEKTTTIIAGDFNTVLNPTLDRSTNAAHIKQSQSAKVIQDYMEEIGLGDGWRLKHPNKREYTFFSSVHHSFSRIDLFLINNSITQNITTEIHPIIISDHAPISLHLELESTLKTSSSWRFNTSLLRDQKFDEMIRREWANFLADNDSPNLSPSLLWETGKAVIRGKIISYSSYKKKQEQRMEKDLEAKIKLLTEQYANNPEEQIWNQLQNTKMQLETIISKKTEFILQQLRYNNFEYSNKSGKFLANQLQNNKEKSLITTIQDPSGTYTQSPEDINQIFYKFYQNLYTKAKEPNPQDIQGFLNNIHLPKISIEQLAVLDAPITINDLENALSKMPIGKAPGPDGFPVEFLKHFWSILAPFFLE